MYDTMSHQGLTRTPSDALRHLTRRYEHEERHTEEEKAESDLRRHRWSSRPEAYPHPREDAERG
jgi:hypothetical protein